MCLCVAGWFGAGEVAQERRQNLSFFAGQKV